MSRLKKPLSTIRYYTKSCQELTESEIQQSSDLFSSHYGYYSSHAPEDKKNQRIRLNIGYYEKFKKAKHYYVSMAYAGTQLVGHAYYLRLDTPKGKVSWVVQLVVHESYRRNSIGKKLLHSVWAFSNDFAWGLATSNPLTVKTLESATIRKVIPEIIKKNIETIYTLSDNIDFVNRGKIEIDENRSSVNTSFFVDQSEIMNLIKEYSGDWKLGELEEGCEWIAFTFKEQDTRKLSKAELDEILEHSDNILKEAYSRMEFPDHDWNKHTTHEIEFILKTIDSLSTSSKIVDFGCGYGRHLIELESRGYKGLKGIDFSESNITHGKKLIDPKSIELINGDCRNHKFNDNFDLVLCLYDVIGSFPKEADNLQIVQNINASLKTGGYAAISVMNMELTKHLIGDSVDLLKDPKPLFNLPASNTMQTTGDIFNPKFILIDSHSNLVYRKEMFENENQISAEYIIRDRRYTQNELKELLVQNGFEIIEMMFVQAGKWDKKLEPTNKGAKEILTIVRKVRDACNID